VEDVFRLLEGMGSTPDEVAATLLLAGVHGLRGSTRFLNPVVRYVKRNLEVGCQLAVGGSGTVLRLRLCDQETEVALPPAVQGFLDCFHRGLYPDLELGEGEALAVHGTTPVLRLR
jgi:hypothetical protein